MTAADEYERVPEPVPPLPLEGFGYEDLAKDERIGTGGDADVYRATVDRGGYTYPVAVKEPRFDGTVGRGVVEQFQQEAETWSGLDDHDNVVSVYGWGTEPLPWLALEYMDGGTLEARLESVDLAEALWLAGRVAEGVRHGHRHGVAHLDVKPTNVLLRDTGAGTWDYPKVSDWGLAKLLLDHSNSVEGISPTYAAPEQFDAETYGDPDDRTDIYQLGALVYALVTGRPPFTGASTAVMQGVLQDDPDPPSTVAPGVPESVDEVVLRALEKNKHDRYEGVLPLRKDLDRLFESVVDGGADPGGTAAPGPTDSGTGGDGSATTGPPDGPRGVDPERPGSPDSRAGANHGDPPSARGAGGEPPGDPEDDSSPLARRAFLGLLGVGVVGGGGWFAATQLDAVGGGTAGTLTDTPEPDRRETPEPTPDVVATPSEETTRQYVTATPTRTSTPTLTEEAPPGEALFYDGFEDGTYEDTWDVTVYHEEESISQENGILRYASPSAATLYEKDIRIRSIPSIRGSGVQVIEAEHRVEAADYSGMPIFRLFDDGTDNQTEIREHKWSDHDRFYVFASGQKSKLDAAVDSTDWIRYRLVVDFDAGEVLRVERGDREYEVGRSLGSPFRKYTLGLGDANGAGQYRYVWVYSDDGA